MNTVNGDKIKVMVVDDHPLMRVGITSIVNARSDMTVVAQAGSGEEAVALFSKHRPDVTLMDLRLPGMSGVDSIRAIREAHGFQPEAHVGIGSVYEDKGEYELAAREFKIAVDQLADTEPIIYQLLGAAYEKTGSNRDAMKVRYLRSQLV